ncbi:UNVERIFIED_CONTAM: hypothetical protein Sindi_0736300 [Sesamum indicum]
MKAVLDFFSTGRLLKQINNTLLTLIPKVHSPMSVADFRLISCCNVLYKILAKLIVQSYNQALMPPRYALKVDMRKAYDTVEWDFLLSVLQLFGFPETFSRWIEECVTSPSFLGDPLSAYLFVLVMEVLYMELLQLIQQDMRFTFHWKCEALRVFQLGFTNDLLLFSRASTDSIKVFKNGLNRFADWSGLRLNVEKSHLIISRSTQNVREELLAVLGFLRGSPPDEASVFILPKSVIKDIEKRLRAFLWKGTENSWYSKVAWKEICATGPPWVEWLYHGRLRDTSICTVIERGRSWSWRKMLRLCSVLQPMIDYHIGDGRRYYLWKNPWHTSDPSLTNSHVDLISSSYRAKRSLAVLSRMGNGTGPSSLT